MASVIIIKKKLRSEPKRKIARVERESAISAHSMKIVYKVQNAQSVKEIQACRIIVSN